MQTKNNDAAAGEPADLARRFAYGIDAIWRGEDNRKLACPPFLPELCRSGSDLRVVLGTHRGLTLGLGNHEGNESFLFKMPVCRQSRRQLPFPHDGHGEAVGETVALSGMRGSEYYFVCV